MNLYQISDLFKDEMLKQGITPPMDIRSDGQLHRFHIDGDKKSSKNGWYVLYSDGVPCGVFGSWKKGITWKWYAKKINEMSPLERNKQMEQINNAYKIRNEIKEQEQCEASIEANYLWSRCSLANPDHAYLVRKHIYSFCAKQYKDQIVLPIIDCSGKIWSLQYIYESGDKRFLSDGALKGHFILVQDPENTEDASILICEGFATGATLAMSNPKACVVAACNALNVEPVAVSIRKHFPNVKIIICADDDRLNPDNPGITKGRKAAIAAGALFHQPKWPVGAPESLTDYNDLACWNIEQKVNHV